MKHLFMHDPLLWWNFPILAFFFSDSRERFIVIMNARRLLIEMERDNSQAIWGRVINKQRTRREAYNAKKFFLLESLIVRPASRLCLNVGREEAHDDECHTVKLKFYLKLTLNNVINYICVPRF